MHRLATTPGDWNPNHPERLPDQTPAPLVVLTAADTDIQCLAATLPHLPSDFIAIRAINLLQLQHPFTIDDYADRILSQAQGIILRLLGGRSYWSYGLEVVRELATEKGIALWVLPGDHQPDGELMSHSNLPVHQVHQLWQYLQEGGRENWQQGLQWVSNLCLGTNYEVLPLKTVPNVGLYEIPPTPLKKGGNDRQTDHLKVLNKVGVLFYRSHYLAGNTLVIDELCRALQAQNLTPIPLYVSSLRDPDVQEQIIQQLQLDFKTSSQEPVKLILNTTSFSLAQLQRQGVGEDCIPLWQQLDIPILQVILSGGTQEQWQESLQGLNPRDLAMNVVLPEVDGRIITRAISFKAMQQWHETLQTPVMAYQSVGDRLDFVAELSKNYLNLSQTPPQKRKIAIILANYPNKDGRLANGVGLDTPASCLKLLQALQEAGYTVENLPQTTDELMHRLTSGITNDLESQDYRQIYQTLSLETFQTYFQTLPATVQQQIGDRWSNRESGIDLSPLLQEPTNNLPPLLQEPTNNLPPLLKEPTTNLPPLLRGVGGITSLNRVGGITPSNQPEDIPIPGIQLGNIFVGIQPSRGYDLDPSLNYHAPDLEPPPHYLAFYHWLTHNFQTQALIHLGKHGNLEWLPGKSIALSATCYPEITLGPFPHFYPFIVNDPGEGSQAKRRSQAVIIDHLTPPLTRAELYGDLQQIENLIDEYYEAQNLDPNRLPLIRDRLLHLLQQTQLHQDLGITDINRQTIQAFLTVADGYLCELKEAQIRDGLHILGECPQNQQLRDLMISIARSPSYERQGLLSALIDDLKLDIDLKDLYETEFRVYQETIDFCIENHYENLLYALKICRHNGDVIEQLELFCQQLIEKLIAQNSSYWTAVIEKFPTDFSQIFIGLETQKVLGWIAQSLLPNLVKTDQEITNLLKGLNGQYVPSGASGAPTRGRPEVLPTGRNFYAVDIRAIPTETAWDVGRKAAENVIERYTQEQGEYPKTLAMSIWGTSTMRTGGDDVAQVLALLGVKPVWDGSARRVIDFEILPITLLGRPRVDVTVRISGFFRDSFPNLVNLMQSAIAAVSQLTEDPEVNPLAAQVQQEQKTWQATGFTAEQALTRATYRIFGSKPGAYGAGLQGLMESQNWQSDQDLAKAYLNWSSYAYDAQGMGHNVPDIFQQRLKNLAIILHNQDNREHDLLDSDDYYQFQGGLTAAVRALTGKNPQIYFGDHSRPENPRVKLLKEEIAKVYRSRVINPKWIAGVMRHGYKGAFEMAATLDYLFAYDATTHCVEDFMYQGIAEQYLLNPEVQKFIEQKNPWALRDMAERLLEAHQRQLWVEVSTATLEQLRSLVHQAEGVIEMK